MPGKAISNLMVRAMKSASARDVAERRAEIVTAVSEVSELEFVNGGGTGSIELTPPNGPSPRWRPDLASTLRSSPTTTRPSGPRPAAMFALPVARGPGVAPSVALALRAQRFPAAARHAAPAIGDRVYFRDLEAGELCERFDRLFLVTGTTIRDEVRTYRGEGKGFI